MQASWEVMQPLLATRDFAAVAGVMGVYVGIQQMEYGAVASAHLDAMGAFAATGSPFSVAAGRISFHYGLKGELCMCSVPIGAETRSMQMRHICTVQASEKSGIYSERIVSPSQGRLWPSTRHAPLRWWGLTWARRTPLRLWRPPWPAA